MTKTKNKRPNKDKNKKKANDQTKTKSKQNKDKTRFWMNLVESRQPSARTTRDFLQTVTVCCRKGEEGKGEGGED